MHYKLEDKIKKIKNINIKIFIQIKKKTKKQNFHWINEKEIGTQRYKLHKVVKIKKQKRNSYKKTQKEQNTE